MFNKKNGKINFNKEWSNTMKVLAIKCYSKGHIWPSFICWCISTIYKLNLNYLDKPIMYISNRTTNKYQWQEAKEHLCYVEKK
jgi:hypothetical protein